MKQVVLDYDLYHKELREAKNAGLEEGKSQGARQAYQNIKMILTYKDNLRTKVYMDSTTQNELDSCVKLIEMKIKEAKLRSTATYGREG